METKESVERVLRVVKGRGNVLVMRHMAKADEWKQRLGEMGMGSLNSVLLYVHRDRRYY